jgi:hypothetical protein
MEELIRTLELIGVSADECALIRAYYGNNIDSLREHVLYMRALFDDRHEYVD